MAAFIRLLLERYTEQFSAEQKDLILQWESELCETSGEVEAGAESSGATSLARVEEFFVVHCGEIVQLSKETLRDVVMSNQAHKHKVWMQAQKFYIRHVHLVTPEQQELLDDWEFLLCDMSYLQPVAFLPRLQRCLDRSGVFFDAARRKHQAAWWQDIAAGVAEQTNEGGEHGRFHSSFAGAVQRSIHRRTKGACFAVGI